jgi:peptide/nickel transport system substrate-binding protein
MAPRTIIWVLGIALLIAACSPAQPAGTPTAPGAPAPAREKALVIAFEAEPDVLVTSMNRGTAGTSGNLKLAIHQYLSTFDDRGGLHPMLAAALPASSDGTWIVRPDGTMQTTYRLRDGITWHDGTPLTARDFVFAWTVVKDPDLPMADRAVANQVTQIATPDPQTLVIEWSRTYPFANAITEDDLGPLPIYLLEDAYQTDKQRFAVLPYWTREFVGVGPYQIAEWEPGSHLVLTAYHRFYGGRAKIDRLTFRFIPDPSAVVANLMAGSVDGTVPGALDFNQFLFVKDEWMRAGRKPLTVVQPSNWPVLATQFRDPQPAVISDVRIRRGLLHAIDRQALVDTLFAGQSPLSHTFIPTDDVRWDWVQDVAVRYDYDPRRAQELLTAGAWRRGADGVLRDAAGERARVSLWNSGSDPERIPIIADYWKAAGLEVEQGFPSLGQQRDNQYRASFPSFTIVSLPLRPRNTWAAAYGPSCPTAQSRWVGSNYGCYQNPELDRAVAGLQGAIDPSDQRRLYRDLIRILTEEIPLLPLYFGPKATIFREGVSGVKGDTNPRSSPTWNVAEWDLAT